MFAGLVLATALSQAPAANAEAVPATMLVWSTAKTRAEAETQLSAATAAAKGWPYFAWAAGWPQIVESAKVTGLKPGSFVVALGACFPPEGDPLLSVLKVLEPAVSAKPVTWLTPLPCPQGVDGWSWGSSAHWKSGERELVAVPLQKGEHLLFAARALRGAESVLKLLDSDNCDPGSLKVTRAGLSVDAVCITGRCNNTVGHSQFSINLRIVDNSPQLESTLLKSIDTPDCH